MNLAKLFDMQRALDHYIEKENNLLQEDLFDRKVLALLVEIGELANETRCFKFWSKRGPSERPVILEEYVDGVHFILSLGLEQRLEEIVKLNEDNPASSLTEQFLKVMDTIQTFRTAKSTESYNQLFNSYIMLGQMLGFSEEEIEQAYFNKNEVNYKRQQEGY